MRSLLLVLLPATLAAADPVFRETKGIVMIEATLLRRDSDQLTARVNGRSMTFPLDILSKEDRAFIDEWSPE